MAVEQTFPTEAQLEPIQALYDQGLFQQAFQAASSVGPLQSWRGAHGRILSGRLARHLGGTKFGIRQILRAWRHDPADWQARSAFLWMLSSLRGPVAIWQRLNEFGEPPADDLKARCEVYALRAHAAAPLRDFDRADYWFGEAKHIGPALPWLAAERSVRLELEDRYEEALQVARESLEAHPDHWLLLARLAHSLQLLGRDDALAVLESSFPKNESFFRRWTSSRCKWSCDSMPGRFRLWIG
jgi:tetratricopeptide (TPR) repeat protein